MFQSLGALEIAIIGVLIIVLFGGKNLANFIRGMSGGVKEYRKSTKEDKE